MTKEEKKAYDAKRYAEKKETISAKNKAYREAHIEEWQAYRRSWELNKRYGVSPEQWADLLDKQGGLCKICGSAPPAGKEKGFFSLDHDHKTKAVRGILCRSCNTALGSFKDNVQFLKNAIDYLEARLEHTPT